MKLRVLDLTTFLQLLLTGMDNGATASVDEVIDHIQEETLFDFLLERLGKKTFDTTIWEDKADEIMDAISTMLADADMAYDNRTQKLRVEKDGLLLVVAFIIAAIQQSAGDVEININASA